VLCILRCAVSHTPQIVDEDLKVVPRNTKGEIVTKGYSVMLGYWGDEAKTKEVRASCAGLVRVRVLMLLVLMLMLLVLVLLVLLLLLLPVH
jgi:hypothetical protein